MISFISFISISFETVAAVNSQGEGVISRTLETTPARQAGSPGNDPLSA